MSTTLVVSLLALSGFALAPVSWLLWKLAATATPAAPTSATVSTEADMLYALTHDMSNPLQEILATLANMKSVTCYEEAQLQQDIESLYRATSYLAELASNFKSLSLLDAPDSVEQCRLVNLAGVAQSIIMRMGNMAEREGVRLTYQGSDTSAKVWANESDLERMLTNLVHNGIKYRNKSVEQCEVVVTLRPDTNQTLLVEVEDNGMGIPARRVASLWDQPFQPRSARTIGIHGTGLGLYLVKRIADKYQGRVDVESEVGRGTRFMIQFPVAQSQ